MTSIENGSFGNYSITLIVSIVNNITNKKTVIFEWLCFENNKFRF